MEMKERYRGRQMRCWSHCTEGRRGGREEGEVRVMWFSGDGGGITMRAQEGAAGRECAVEELVLEVRSMVMRMGTEQDLSKWKRIDALEN